MHPYLHYSIGLHGNGAAQHGLTVTVQAVPGDGGAGLSGSLAFQVDGLAQLDPDGSRGRDDGHRRVWGDQNSRRAQPLGGAPLSEPEQVWNWFLSSCCFTFHDHRHDGVGDPEQVAGHAAVRTVVLRLDVDDGDDGTVAADFDIICSEIQRGR